MAPKVTTIPLKNETTSKNITKPEGFDYSKICVWTADDWMRARLDYVEEHNEPIKDKIAEGHILIDETRKKLYNLKRMLKDTFDLGEKESLTWLIRKTKNDLWGYCCRNCYLAFSLKKA